MPTLCITGKLEYHYHVLSHVEGIFSLAMVK